MKSANFKLQIWVICLLGYLFIGLFSQAKAQAVSLRVYPSLIKINAESPSDLNTNINIENLSDKAVEIETQIKLFKTQEKENGQVEYLKSSENPNEILNRIQILSKDNVITGLSLGPKQKTSLKLKISLNENDLGNDYYFSVIFITKSKASQVQNGSAASIQSSFSKINMGVAANVLLSAGSAHSTSSGQTSAAIEEFSSPQYVEKGPLPFTIKIHNNGSTYISPKGRIEITNMFGQRIGKVDLPAQNILANSSRYLATQDQLITYNSSLITPKAVWPEKFLLGFYKSTLVVELSDKGPTLDKTIQFFAFPSKFILVLIIAIVIFLLIRRRVKQKML